LRRGHFRVRGSKRDEDLQRYGIMRRKEAALYDARNYKREISTYFNDIWYLTVSDDIDPDCEPLPSIEEDGCQWEIA